MLGTAIDYVLLFEILTGAGASNAMLVTLPMPVTALLLGNSFLAEPILVYELAGAAIIGLRLFCRRPVASHRAMGVVSEHLGVPARR